MRPQTEVPGISFKRLWLFRIATAIVIPVLMIVTLEAALRLSGYGYRSEFVIPCDLKGRSAYCDNDHFTWQFFPPGAFRLPPAFAIPAEKPPRTFRIFIVGESAAQGDPEPSYAFSRYLEVMLRERFPALNFEVINTGITAINSHVLLPVARDLAQFQADLFVLYIGNNEVVGPYGAGNTFTARGGSLPIIRAGIYLKSTRLGQLIGAALARRANAGHSATNWQGMEMFLEQQVAADAPAMTNVYGNFRSNLRDIVATTRRSGAKVVLSTVAVNLKDAAPFGSQHRADLSVEERHAWDARVEEGGRLEAAGQHAEAIAHYLAAAAIDNRHAELQFRIGRAYLALGKAAEARQRLQQARDLDVLRFRADSQVNAIIRGVAAEAGPAVELLDTEALFAGESPNGLPGRELFYEHVHMNFRGNYLIARELFPKVVALLPAEQRHSTAAAAALSQQAAERLLALTPFDRQRIAQTVSGWLSQPPFTLQLNHGEQLRAMQRELAAMREDAAHTEAMYRAAIARSPGDRWLHFNYGVFLEARDPAAAATEFRAALEILPGSYAASDRLAVALVRMEKYEEGIAQCRQLLRRMPYHPPAYLTMAYALAKLGSYDESVSTYQHAMTIYPAYALDAHYMIGIIRTIQGRFADAAASFQNAIEADTGHLKTAELYYNLSVALAKLGRDAEAEQAMQRANAGR